ncbi:hypothetical protein MACK_003042 [Theileria orientalis]|uniref:LsmAD domain-containing protein n=1 Tax=Theileria orientalis TaxID=68886 RepID=A0A976QXJ4_THEOR|nr:hypothetical protein MACK_003042 [Theileria orientalis]
MYRNTNPALSSANPGPFKHDKKLSYFLKINEERLALVMSSLIDREVEVNLEDGTQVKGIFNSFDPASRGGNKAVDIAINSYVTNGTAKKTLKPMIVCGTEYHFFSSHGIAKTLFKPREQKPLSAKRTPTKFKTDTEISASKQTSINPVLTEWKPTESVDDSQLVELDKVEGEQWDQFETNRNEYGVVSTFDENMYTTSLDLNEVPDSVKERAEKLAAEIEGGSETNYSKVEALLEDEDVVENESPVVKSFEEEREVEDEDFKELREEREDREFNDPGDYKEVKDSRDMREARDVKRKEKSLTSVRTKSKFSAIDSTVEKNMETSNGILVRFTMHSDKLETDRQTSPSKPKVERHTHQIGVNALNIEPTNLKADSFRFGFSERKNKYSLEQEKKEKFDAPPATTKPHDKQLYVLPVYTHPYNHFRPSPHPDTTKLAPEHPKDSAREPHKEPYRVALKETPRDHAREVPRSSPKEGLKDAQRETTKESPKDTVKFTTKKSFKFNPNASTFTPTLVTAKTPSMPSDQSPLSSPAISPLAIQQAKYEFRPFNPMKRYPRLDLRSARTAESARFGEHDFGYRWEVDPSLSYRDIFGDLNPLFAHQHHIPMKPPAQMVQPGQPGPAMMPPGAQMNYPPYHVGSMPVGMVPYGPQVHPRLYNGVPYNHMGPNPMTRRGHPPLNPRYGHSSPLPNDQYMSNRASDHYDDKANGYGGHIKHKK